MEHLAQKYRFYIVVCSYEHFISAKSDLLFVLQTYFYKRCIVSCAQKLVKVLIKSGNTGHI